MKNLFLVHTEYHFMLAVQIITSLINNRASENLILFTLSKARRNSIMLNSNGNIKIAGIEAPITPEAVKPYLEDTYDNFYYFQNVDIRNRWITWQLKKKGTTVHLVQDGMAAYCYNDPFLKLPMILRDTLQDYKTLNKGRFKFDKLFVTNNFRYGYNSATDKLLLTNPEKFDRKKRGCFKETIKIPALGLEARESLWQFLPKSDLPQSENIVLLINQPLWSEALFQSDIAFIKSVLEKFADLKVFMKLHPLTTKKHWETYTNIERLNIVESTVPVELMMQSLKNSIIISGYSTALIANSTAESNNRYYYYFPVYKKTGDKAMMRKQIVVFDHINVVESAEQIK